MVGVGAAVEDSFPYPPYRRSISITAFDACRRMLPPYRKSLPPLPISVLLLGSYPPAESRLRKGCRLADPPTSRSTAPAAVDRRLLVGFVLDRVAAVQGLDVNAADLAVRERPDKQQLPLATSWIDT